jgi:hypothetical protein
LGLPAFGFLGALGFVEAAFFLAFAPKWKVVSKFGMSGTPLALPSIIRRLRGALSASARGCSPPLCSPNAIVRAEAPFGGTKNGESRTGNDELHGSALCRRYPPPPCPRGGIDRRAPSRGGRPWVSIDPVTLLVLPLGDYGANRRVVDVLRGGLWNVGHARRIEMEPGRRNADLSILCRAIGLNGG